MKRVVRITGKNMQIATASARGKSKDNSFKQTQTEPLLRLGQLDIIGTNIELKRLEGGDVQLIITPR